MSVLISMSKLSKSYKNKRVLHDVNLQVKAGQILGVVGPNGAGKTTLLQSVLGLIQYQGTIDVLGYNPQKQRDIMLNDLAYIADVAVLPKWLKVNQALTYMQGIHPKFNRAKAEVFLARTNIPEKAKVNTLSKGMVTQLHLALILAIDAKVLILDEPTLGLDILTRGQFYSHLLDDFYTEQKCIIVTTHQIEEIEHIVTDVAFIRDGCIVLAERIDNVRKRFKMLTVSEQNLAPAKALNPLYATTIMGITRMLFDQPNTQKLTVLGDVTSPSLADIFIAIMTSERPE